MTWPPRLADVLERGNVRLDRYEQADAEQLLVALNDDRAWEHIPRAIPTSPQEFHEAIAARLADGLRITFTIRRNGEPVGVTSVISVTDDLEAVEIGATQLSPAVWGTGLNGVAKALLIGALFESGASEIRFRTDERNDRSAAAIRKLGAVELGVMDDTLVRRDGSQRRSRFFRLRPLEANISN